MFFPKGPFGPFFCALKLCYIGKMKMYYITLNSQAEAKAISHDLLNQGHAVCTNWFPIMCAYKWEGEVKEEAEVVLILKTKEGKRNDIEKAVSQHIDYTNCIAELDVHSANQGFLQWLDKDVS